MSERPRLFCSRPFSWFEISTWTGKRGDCFLCCPSWLQQPIGNIQDSSVEEVWNGPIAADLRRSILDGSFDQCSRAKCPFLGTKSGPVQAASDVSDPMMRRAIDENLTVLPWGPLEINACFDQSCNLSCPSCRTSVIMEHNARDEILSIQRTLQAQALQDAKMLYLSGSADPFGSPFIRTWLQNLRRSDMPQIEKVHLHTNALLWTKRTWNLIPPEIQEVVRSSEISIDAASAATYAENRRGGDFNRLLENLEFIASNLRPPKGPIQWLGFSMVVQYNNFREMKDFIRLGKRFNVNRVTLAKLINWGTFSDEEYQRRAVHLPSHPAHEEFLDVLRDPFFDDPVVFLGNISDFREKTVEPSLTLKIA